MDPRIKALNDKILDARTQLKKLSEERKNLVSTLVQDALAQNGINAEAQDASEFYGACDKSPTGVHCGYSHWSVMELTCVFCNGKVRP